MKDLRGNVIVTVRFEIPVSESLYPRVKDMKGKVLPEDIVAAEEQNYLDNTDNYLDIVGDHITEVGISFEETE